MKKLILSFWAVAVLALSCEKFDDTKIWDKLDDHENRISALEKMCREMNTNIEALQTIVEALQKNEYVTSVVPITEGSVEVGYTIAFSSGKYITIYHGKDRTDGSDGKDGYTPNIGVKKDVDGVYYWTIDGEWLLDDAGNKIPTTGKDGQNGADGKDAIMPHLKIENGMWYVSYDNGASWVELSQATGDQGSQGTPGVNGDVFFQSVTETEEYISMILANGTEIKIPKYSAVAATLTLGKVTGFTATFDGQVVRHSLDLKVTVYYSTTDNLTVYKHKGKTSVTDFNGDTFTLRLTELAPNTTYYYFTEVVCDGTTTFSKISSFRTDKEDSYVDWGEGENVGGEI